MSIRIVLAGILAPGQHRLRGARHEDHGARASCAWWRPSAFRRPRPPCWPRAPRTCSTGRGCSPTCRSAVADCGLVVGTTARARHLPWRTCSSRARRRREIAAAATTSEVAVLFGAERTGLTNDELELLPAAAHDPDGLGLRVAERRDGRAGHRLRDPARAARCSRTPPAERGIPLASAREMERFYAHLEQVLEEIEFRDRTGEGHLMARLRRVLQSRRARPERDQHPARHPHLRAGQAAARRRAARRRGERPRHERRRLPRQRGDHAGGPARRRGDARPAWAARATSPTRRPVGHAPGRRARARVEQAREEVAALVGADPRR